MTAVKSRGHMLRPSRGGILFLQGLWEQCQLLKSASVFAHCHPLVAPEPFVALCERTLCKCTQGLTCPCVALLEYARACAQHGMVLNGWTKHSACRESLPPSLAGAVCGAWGRRCLSWVPSGSPQSA